MGLALKSAELWAFFKNPQIRFVNFTNSIFGFLDKFVDVLILGGEAISLSFMHHEASSSIVQVVGPDQKSKKGPKLLKKVKNGIFKASV
jgi:hypothetical protein